MLNVNVALTCAYPFFGVVTSIWCSSWSGVPMSLQVLVGWALAAGIVPVHCTVTVSPAFAGTVTESDAGADASVRSAAKVMAAATRQKPIANLGTNRIESPRNDCCIDSADFRSARAGF